jgi:short-subunit dehydrogenase
MTPETVLVTGASSGIGRELARCFAADGSRLVLVARSGGALETLADELRKAHKVDARVLVADLALPDAPTRLLKQLHHHGLKVDVLVNNAGFGAQGRFAELLLDRQLQMVQVKITALTHLTRLLLPGMIERRRGGVLNVASTAAFQPGPQMAVYSATKAYVLSFGEALAEEVAGTGVTVTALCPGPTETGFGDAAQMKDSRLFRLGRMSAQKVAEIGHQAFRRGRVVVVPGLRNRLLAFSVRFSPRSVARKIAGALNKSS